MATADSTEELIYGDNAKSIRDWHDEELAPGCRSSVKPCMHQKLSPYSIVTCAAGEGDFVDPASPNTETILSERKQTHGDFSLDAAMAQALKQTLRQGENWERLSPTQREALELICTKLARIMVGNYLHRDHWSDIAGYARLVEQRLP